MPSTVPATVSLSDTERAAVRYLINKTLAIIEHRAPGWCADELLQVGTFIVTTNDLPRRHFRGQRAQRWRIGEPVRVGGGVR